MAPRVFNANEFKHVDVIDDFANDKSTGDPRVECLYCELQFVGHSTRIRAHLAGLSGVGVAACSTLPEEVKQEMIRVTIEKTLERDSQAKKRTIADNIRSAERGASSSSAPQTSFEVALARGNKAEVDAALARCFFGCGKSFNVVISRYFKEMLKAVGSFGSSYQPPGIEFLRDKLLQDAVQHVGTSLEPIKSNNSITGYSLTSDGWSDTRSRPLINVLQLNTKGALFLGAVDSSGETVCRLHCGIAVAASGAVGYRELCPCHHRLCIQLQECWRTNRGAVPTHHLDAMHGSHRGPVPGGSR
jgi:hypothetical protein